MIRSNRLSACLLIVLSIALPGVAKASDLCEKLNARLADLPGITARADNTRVYSNAISRQTIELRKTRSQLRQLGCSSGSVIVYGNANDDECDMLADTIDRMQDNLQDLDEKRQDAASARGDSVIRNRIAAALEANGCNDDGREVLEAAVGEEKIHRNILKDLPPASESLPMLDDDSMGVTGFELDGAPVGGGLRTLCVRTCDGSFFPISSDASPRDFERDAQLCSMQCPGAETELYYHSLQTQEADQMISARTGEPYSAMPTAFAYRTRNLDASQPNACSCRAATLTEKPVETNQSKAVQTEFPSITDLRTETKPAEKTEPKIIEDRPYDPKAKVRIVGPTYLPQEETSIDLRHPAEAATQ
ncbi:DUF2865 domain-containing protein [Pararhizobium sp.]|uniref:DUF2865 domain-containing protein n=1 Tax=Pararhizobium sp. TaxID=1977563 RepID=UPI00271D0701|nr:DUF2865 domain-containing protein [Pararhizobium sp.]MDO9418931.1 DUF2865 domain-containing protein [Pararhizobium sp.]